MFKSFMIKTKRFVMNSLNFLIINKELFKSISVLGILFGICYYAKYNKISFTYSYTYKPKNIGDALFHIICPFMGTLES